jgi:tetratricopeptide (TPR) repeat protein
VLTAADLHQRGLLASNAGRHRRARGLFDAALERCDDDETRARILLSLAHVASELGSRQEGLKLCDEALAVGAVPLDLVGLVQSQRGLLLMRAGDGDEALAAFAEALRLLGSAPQARCRVHLNRGNVHLQRGDALRARRDFERASACAEESGDAVQQARIAHNIGYTHLLTGDLITALRMMDAARPVLVPLSRVSEAVCEQDRAEVLSALGMVSDAEASLQAAARAFGARGLSQQQGEAEFVLAKLLLLDRPADAATVGRRARRRFERRDSVGWALRADAVATAAELASSPTSARVLEHADRLATQLSSAALRTEASTVRLYAARALAGRDRLDDACAQLERAKVSKRSALTVKLLAREVQARVARRKGRRADVVHHLRRGLAELHEWQSSFGSLELQSSLVGHGRGLAVQGLEQAIDDGRPAVVFEWSERARALAGRVPPVRPPADAAAAADLSRLRQLRLTMPPAGADPSSGLQREVSELTDRIRRRAWYDSGSGLVTEPCELDVLVAELQQSDGALVAYLAVNAELHALVVAGGRSSVVRLGPMAAVRTLLDGMQADLDMAASRLPEPLRAAVGASLTRRLDLLSAALVTPIRSSLGEGPVAVVPAGALAAVPWSLLDGLSGRPLTVPRSASSWVSGRATRPVATTAGLVAGPGVARAEEEVRRAAGQWGGSTVLSGSGALAVAVRDLAQTVDVFHVAAHGRHAAENPLFSAVELADGPLFGYDIDRLDAVPGTVVLSACEVGRSSVRWGEETLGMTVAWLHAGARCVIASPASVNDDVACEVLAATHALLAAGVAPSPALASATRGTGSQTPAPFICFGTGW